MLDANARQPITFGEPESGVELPPRKGKHRWHKRMAPPGERGYRKQCPGCGQWFTTHWLRQKYHNWSCYTGQSGGPTHRFIKMLGGHEKLAELMGIPSRTVRLWYIRGIPKHRLEWFEQHAQTKGLDVTISDIMVMNIENAKWRTVRPKRNVPGPFPVQMPPLEEVVRPARYSPTEQEMVVLLDLMDGQGHLVADQDLANGLRSLRWIEPSDNGFWYITQAGLDLVLSGSIDDNQRRNGREKDRVRPAVRAEVSE